MANQKTLGGIHYEIMRRCYNPKYIMYKKYGAKGITVCDEWHDKEAFIKWATDNGWEPGMLIERIDATRGYFPDNCRFGSYYKKKSPKHVATTDDVEPMRYVVGTDFIVKNNSQGYGIRVEDNPLHVTYTKMIDRCCNPKSQNYKTYGGAGIFVCPEWQGENGEYNFTVWAMNNGWQKGLSIDRIDNNRGYYPANCRWVELEKQYDNKKINYKLFYNGESKRIADIASETKIDPRILYKGAVTCGIPIETVISIALTTKEYYHIQ